MRNIIYTLLIGFLALNVNAQSTTDTSKMKHIIIGDILIQDQPIRNNTHAITIDDRTQSRNQVKNVADLFKGVSGFSLVKRSAYAMDPVFRSFKYDQLNIQYDGGTKCMHACPNRMDPTTTFIIPEEIEKMEIIRGPFSGRYGANFGGVVNMVTQRAPGVNEMGIHGNVLAGYRFGENSLTTSAALGYANEKYNVIFNGSMRDFGNYTDGNGTEVASSFKSYDYSLKTGYNLSKNQRVQLNWRQSFGRDVLHAGLPMDTEHDNSSILSADYVINNISDKLFSIQAKAYYSYVDHLMTNFGRPNFKVVEASTPVEATTMGGKLELQFTPSEKHMIYLGSDVSMLARNGDRTRVLKRNPMDPTQIFETPKLFTDSIWQDASTIDLGLFVEGKYYFNDKFKFDYGLRLDYVQAKTDNPVKEFTQLYEDFENVVDVNIGGHIAANYRINKDLNVQLAIGRGERSASMEEKFINHLSINVDPYEYVGNPLLKPEANHQIELSLTGRTAGVQYGTSVYYSYITDYITAVVDSSIKRKYLAFKDPKVAKQFRNIDVATQAGIEVYVEVPIYKALSIRGDLAYVDAKNVDWDEPLPQISPLKSVITLKYEKDNFWTDLSVKMVAKQDKIALSYGEQETPGYNLLDFNIGYKPWNNLTLAAGVLNILDEYYYDHLNFSFNNSSTSDGKIYEQGRNFNVFVKYDF